MSSEVTVTAEEKKALFSQLEEAIESDSAAREEILRQQKARQSSALSEILAKISTACGNGPFSWKGRQFKIVKAKNSETLQLRFLAAVEEIA